MSEGRDATRIDALVEQFVSALRAGRAPSIDEFVHTHPDLADRLRPVLRAASVVETASAATTEPHDSFPGLEVLREVAPGTGAMGRVYAAREVSLDRVVAVKTIQEHMRTSEGREFFLREARAAAKLDHPNVVKVFSFDPDHVPPYYVMQYVEGVPLDEACRGRDAVLIARIVEQVARGLAFAHERGIVHRDVKPANVLVTSDGVPHITDFGLAKPVSEEQQAEVGASTLKGTPRYIAPEVYAGATDAGPAGDVYALGITLYELLCLRPAFAERQFAALRDSVLEREPDLPQKILPQVPEPLQRICLMAIEKDPADRYASATEMADDLQRFCLGTPVSARPKRYERAARGRMQTHVSEIHSWHQQNLIPTGIMDRLLRPYRLVLQDDSPWDRLARQHPLESTLLRLAAMTLLVCTCLWPLYYWDQAPPLGRVLAVGAPTLLMNAVGWMFHRRGQHVNAAVYLSSGTLLVPLFVMTVLSQLDLPSVTQLPDVELFRQFDPNAFSPTNWQIAIAMFATLWYSSLTLFHAHARVLSIWAGVAGYAFYVSILLVCGMKAHAVHDHVALVTLMTLPAPLLFVYVAHRTRALADGAWSTIFFVGFPIPFVVLMSMLARFGAAEWLASPEVVGGLHWSAPQVQVLLMANGVVYLFVALACRRGWSSAVRFWSPFFLGLAGVSAIVPAHVAFTDGNVLATWHMWGHAVEVRFFQVVAFAAPVALASVAASLRLATLVLPAVLGFGAFLVHFTHVHFATDSMWTLVLASTSIVAMLGSTARMVMRDRRGGP